MLNQVVMVGRLVEDPQAKELEGGNKVMNITLAVPRSYKNTEGEYETDFIDCTLWKGIAANTEEFCKKGDLIGIKGRIETSIWEDKEKNKRKTQQVIAEKVTFLSPKTKE